MIILTIINTGAPFVTVSGLILHFTTAFPMRQTAYALYASRIVGQKDFNGREIRVIKYSTINTETLPPCGNI